MIAFLGIGILPVHAEEVLVSAQRIQRVSTKVLNKEDILSLQEQTLTEVLRHQLGLHVATSGGPFGKKAFFSMRGAESGQVLVVIDGVDMGDPTTPNTAARLEHLSLQDVERLEILKGTQSVLYGDSAIGGVVAITTKRGKTTPTTLRLRYGSFNHQDIGLSTGGVSKKWQYAFSANAQRAEGISAYPRSKDRVADLDPYSRMTLSTRLERSLSPDITVGGGVRIVKANTKYDGFNVDNKENEENFTSFSYNLQYKMMHNRHFNPKVLYTSMSTKRLDTGTFSKGQYFDRPYEGRRQAIEFSNTLFYGDHHSLPLRWEATQGKGHKTWGQGRTSCGQ